MPSPAPPRRPGSRPPPRRDRSAVSGRAAAAPSRARPAEARARARPAARLAAAERALRTAALAYPETHEDFPWPDHRAWKVRKKVFAIVSRDGDGLSVSVKLPWSAEGALQFRFCEPTGYGLGRSGWVTASFAPRDDVPLDVLRSWLDESYRAVAPKRVVASLAPFAARSRPRAK